MGGDDWLKVASEDEHAIAYLKSVENRIREATGHKLVVGEDYLRWDSRAIGTGTKTTNDLELAQLSHNIDKKDEGMTMLRRVISDGVVETTDGKELKMLPEVDGKLKIKVNLLKSSIFGLITLLLLPQHLYI